MVLVAAVVAIGAEHLSGGGGSGTAAADNARPLDPSYFARGACMLLPPTGGDRHTTVFLDAGHGGVDPGGTGKTESGTAISEATLNLPIELDVARMLRAEGFTVAVSRTADTTVLRLHPDDVSQGSLTLIGSHEDAAARDVCANDAHAALLVGIYFDASSSPSTAGSITAYDPARTFSKQNLRFAQLLQADVLKSMNAHGWEIPDDGTLSDTTLGSYVAPSSPGSGLAAAAASYDHILLLGPAKSGYFDTPSEMPGALIEPLYLSDPFEGSIAASATGQQAIAHGISLAVKSYFAPRPRPAPSG